MLKEEIKKIKSADKDLKKFGLTIGIFLLIIGAVLFFLKGRAPFWLVAIGVAFVFMGIAWPKILLPIQKIWMALSIVLGWVMTRIILLFIFYLIFTPIGVLSHIFGKKYLSLKPEKSESYWRKREKTKNPPQRYEQQF